jgi:hypothetical protein
MVGQVIHIAKRTGGQRIAAHFAAAAILAAVSGDRAAFAQCNYEITAILDIGDCDIGDSHTFGQGMNDNADVVGFYRFCAVGNERAFFWSQDTGFITLPHPPGVVRSWAYDISDNRIIVGQHEFTGIGRMGFAYDMATGEYRHLEPLHEGATAMNVSSANAVNSSGVVAGMRIIGKSGNTPHNAVIWRPFEKGSPVEDLGVMNGPNSTSNSLNESSAVVGSSGASATSSLGFIHQDKTVMLPAIPDGISSLALDITESEVTCGGGHIVIDGQTVAHGGIWHNGWIIVIDPPTGFAQVAARHMNNVNQVLLLATQVGGISRPFLWQHGEARDVNDVDISQCCCRADQSMCRSPT